MNYSRQCVIGLFITILGLASLANGEEKSRVWRDKSGQFEVDAVLLKHEGDKVSLRKEDGRVISVPVSALSAADQQYVKEQAADNPFAGGSVEPAGAPETTASSEDRLANPGTVEELPTNGAKIFLKVLESIPPLAPDPLPYQLPEFEQFVRPIDKFDAYTRSSPPLLLDLETSTYGISVHRVGNTVNDAHFGRVYLVNPKERRAKTAMDRKETFKLLDHHIPSRVTLGIAGVDGSTERGGDLVLVEQLVDGKPHATVRWHLPGWDTNGFKPKVEYAKLLDGHNAIIKVNDTVYHWDLKTGKCHFQTDRVTYNHQVVSPGGKYLAIPVSKGCRIIDIAKGELVGTIPFPSTLNAEAHFSPDGTRLALVGGNNYVVWDLAKAEFQSEAKVGTVSGKFIGWIDNRYLLTELGGLVDPQLGIAVWKYYIPGPLKKITTGGGIVFTMTYDVTMVNCLPIPHRPALQMIERLVGDNTAALVGPNTPVSIEVAAPAGIDTAPLKVAFATAAEKAGWKPAVNSEVTLTATITKGDPQKVYYRSLHTSIFGRHDEVVLEPYLLALKIESGGKIIWSRSPTRMIPTVLHMERGESLQDALDKYKTVNSDYIRYVNFPAKILKPEIARSLRTTRIDDGVWVD
jgi:hypothetical protein